MGKVVFIAEKPSVAESFAKALKLKFTRRDGYEEAQNTIVTWCLGHLVTMSYPDAYDPRYKRWSLDTIPFIPAEYKYEVINDPGVRKQFKIVKGLLTREDVDTIYICTDSGREGEYIYRLVAAQAGVRNKKQLRVWIDSFTDAEIIRGIKAARDDSAYDNMGSSAYLRAQEDYLMGINFSRALSLKYARGIQNFLGMDRCVIAVGRVMTCVLGIVVRREREIRAFVKTPFYRVTGYFAPVHPNAAALNAAPPSSTSLPSNAALPNTALSEAEHSNQSNQTNQKNQTNTEPPHTALPGTLLSDPANTAVQTPRKDSDAPAGTFQAEWNVNEKSRYFQSPLLYKDNGFKEEKDARALIAYLQDPSDGDITPRVLSVSHKKEVKNPPLLYNLAELQNDCSRYFKISPDETLRAAQALYEAKLTTYPRTDARVLSSAVAKEIDVNLKGLGQLPMYRPLVSEIAKSGTWKTIGRSRYTNDKAITDHYAIIPTGSGFQNLNRQNRTFQKVYELIVRRFLSVFYPAAVYDKMQVKVGIKNEILSASLRVLKEEGYLACLHYSFFARDGQMDEAAAEKTTGISQPDASPDNAARERPLEEMLRSLKKGQKLDCAGFAIKAGETAPPKRYNSGSMILTMENAGQFIEDESLREQIKGSGIGTSATRAGILAKLVDNQYLNLNKKTQIYTPTQLGEMIYDAVDVSIRPLLDPKLTASWEKGLTQVAEGSTSPEEYRQKLDNYIVRRTNHVKETDYNQILRQKYQEEAQFYPKPMVFREKYRRSSGKKQI